MVTWWPLTRGDLINNVEPVIWLAVKVARFDGVYCKHKVWCPTGGPKFTLR